MRLVGKKFCQGPLPLSDSDLIQSASGGRALQGILLTKHLQDQLEHRDCVLKVPECVSLTGLSWDEEKSLEPVKFSSAHNEDEYKKAMDSLGPSIAGSAGIPVYSYATISLGASEMIQRPHVKERYSSYVKYSIVKLASFSFEEPDYALSDEAKTDLKKISQSLGHSFNVHEDCEQFFHKYGSHINSGPLVFGGSYCWICSSKKFSQEEEEVLEEVRSSAISATAEGTSTGVGTSSNSNFDKIKMLYEGRCSRSALASTQLLLEKNGGQPGASNISQWRSGLITNNSTWSVIDRGSKLIAVWDIIRRNHKQELGTVIGALKEAWEKMTGLRAVQNPEEVMCEVGQWDIQRMSPQHIEDSLNYLLEIKRASPNIWINEYLSKQPLQQLFESIVDSYPEHECIKLLTMQLVEEEEIKKLSTHIFPCIDKVAQWLYEAIAVPETSRMVQDIVDFESFIEFLTAIFKKYSAEPLLDMDMQSLNYQIKKLLQLFQVQFITCDLFISRHTMMF